jgi:hypothetical protein
MMAPLWFISGFCFGVSAMGWFMLAMGWVH